MKRLSRPLELIPPKALGVWLLGLLPLYLGLKGGGYDPLVRNQVGIVAYWVILLGLVSAALPLNRVPRGSWIALALLAGYVSWVALSCVWTETIDQTVADLGRVVTYLGVLALALSIQGPSTMRRMIGSLATSVAIVAIVALLSRLHPAWFPHAAEAAALRHFDRSRLSYPFGSWNGVGEFVAIGMPLVLYTASCARWAAARALSAAAMPAMMLTIYFTFSRASVAVAVLGLGLFVTLGRDRLPKVVTLLVAAIGGAILIIFAGQQDALRAGSMSAAAHHQGDELLLVTLAVCAVVGAIQAAFAAAPRWRGPPSWLPRRRALVYLASGGLAIGIIVALLLGAPGRISSAWEGESVPSGAARLESFGSSGRSAFWRVALKELGSAPLLGTGSGSYESWWVRHRGAGQYFAQDAHSLYLETLGELGIVGFLLILGFIAYVLAIGARRCVRSPPAERTQLAALLAGCAAFALAAAFDWVWELAVIPVTFLLMASPMVGAHCRRSRPPVGVAGRVGGVAIAFFAMVVLAVPLSAAQSLRDSQVEARKGDLSQALGEARDAERVEPWAAGPRLQEALVLETGGRLPDAEAAAQAAVHREPVEWRAWVVLSRLQAERGRIHAAVSSYRRARSLNPWSPLFRR